MGINNGNPDLVCEKKVIFRESNSILFGSYNLRVCLQGYEKMLSKLNFKQDKIMDIQKALHTADINNDKRVDFDEWRQDLKT